MATAKVTLPTVDELLEAGVQFGHETKRWHPLMDKFLFGSKEGIHVFNLEKTLEKLQEAADFLEEAAKHGPVMFVATKRQAAPIVRTESERIGTYFVDQRWPGGLLTNFKVVKNSLNKLNTLEKGFEEGVVNRTKFEVSQMKKEWARLYRLYSGIKSLSGKPSALVVVDANYEIGAIREARKLGIPVVGIVDSNTKPDLVDYVIPANDDAIGSIKIIIKVLADAIMSTNGKHRVTHNLKDYQPVEVEITKVEESENDYQSVDTGSVRSSAPRRRAPKTSGKKKIIKKVRKVKKASPKTAGTAKKGILEKVQEEKKAAKASKVKKAEKKDTKDKK